MTKKILIYSGILAVFTVLPATAHSQESSDRFCREFTQTITIDGEEVQGFGRACKNNKDDDWQIVSQAKPREAKSEKVIVKEHSSPKVVILKKKKHRPYYGHGYGHYGYNNHAYSRHNDFVDKHHYYKKKRHHKYSNYHGKHNFGFKTGFHGRKHYSHKGGHHRKKHFGRKYH